MGAVRVHRPAFNPEAGGRRGARGLRRDRAPVAAQRSPKLLELGAILAFAGFILVAFNADPATSDWVTRYARAIAATTLSVIAFGSLLFVPFTEQYARESVLRRFWSSPRFKQINRQLTTMWALVFAAMVPAPGIAGAIDTHRANLIFSWAIRSC